MKNKFTCRCCGYKTLSEEPNGTYEICSVCFWEDDNFQTTHPNDTGGPNQVSLKEAQRNFFNLGVCEADMRAYVTVPDYYEKDINWQPLV